MGFGRVLEAPRLCAYRNVTSNIRRHNINKRRGQGTVSLLLYVIWNSTHELLSRHRFPPLGLRSAAGVCCRGSLTEGTSNPPPPPTRFRKMSVSLRTKDKTRVPMRYYQRTIAANTRSRCVARALHRLPAIPVIVIPPGACREAGLWRVDPRIPRRRLPTFCFGSPRRCAGPPRLCGGAKSRTEQEAHQPGSRSLRCIRGAGEWEWRGVEPRPRISEERKKKGG